MVLLQIDGTIGLVSLAGVVAFQRKPGILEFQVEF